MGTQIGNEQLFTGGNNPWLDAVTYNAQWARPALNDPTEVRIKLLSSADYRSFIKNPKSYPLANIKIKLGRLERGDGWAPVQSGGSPIKSLPANFDSDIRNAYKSWSDITKLRFTFVDSLSKSDVHVGLVDYYTNGFIDGFGQLGGSHEGIVSIERLAGPGTGLGKVSTSTAGGGPVISTRPSGSPLPFSRPVTTPLPLLLDLNSVYLGEQTGTGSAFLETVIHEIGHGVGFKHPHDDGLGSIPSGVFPGITKNDSSANYGSGLYGLLANTYTVMSYERERDAFGLKSTESTRDATPMALETLGAQIKYGTNRTTNIDSSTYSLASTTSVANGRPAWECIWDAGGLDVIDASDLDADVVINLRPAEMNATRPETGRPQEQYEWGQWFQFSEVLDHLVNTATARPGYLLGSGITEHYLLLTALNQLDFNQIDPIKTTLSQVQNQLMSYYASGLDFNLLGQQDDLLQYVSKPSRQQKPSNDLLQSLIEFQKLTLNTYSELLPESLRIQLSQTQDFKDQSLLQQRILERSAKNVAGHLSFVSDPDVLASQYRGGFTIAAGVTIENAIGGNGNDIITGNAAQNTLIGNAGDDLFYPYSNDNIIFGGLGTDQVVFDYGVLVLSRDQFSFTAIDGFVKATNLITGEVNQLYSIESVVIGGQSYATNQLLMA